MAPPIPPAVVIVIDQLVDHLRAELRKLQDADDKGLVTLTFDIFANESDNEDATVKAHCQFKQTDDDNMSDDIENVLKSSLPQFVTIRGIVIERDYKTGSQVTSTVASADYLVEGSEGG